MNMRAIAAAAFCVLLAACAAGPKDADRQTNWVTNPNPERLIVVTIRNERPAIAPRAGSTARVYADPPRYGLAPSTSLAAQAVASAYKLKEVTSWPIGILGVHCLVFELPPGADRSAVLEQLRRDARVESAQPMNSFQTLSTGGDPYSSLQANLDPMNVRRAHRWSLGEGVRIAIVDTRVDRSHPDLEGRIVSYRDFVGTRTQVIENERHGTAIAGVIAANANNALGIVGIAPAARVYAFRACWRSVSHGTDVCNTLTLAKALVAAIDAEADIVNLSLGGPSDALLVRLVRSGMQRGIHFVGATPPKNQAASFPTSIPGVISVGVMGQEQGADAMLFAPGEDILTLTPNGSYDFLSGSSLAAANITGGLALLLAQKRNLSAAEASRLLSTSISHSQAEPLQGVSVDLCIALTQLRNKGSCE